MRFLSNFLQLFAFLFATRWQVVNHIHLLDRKLLELFKFQKVKMFACNLSGKSMFCVNCNRLSVEKKTNKYFFRIYVFRSFFDYTSMYFYASFSFSNVLLSSDIVMKNCSVQALCRPSDYLQFVSLFLFSTLISPVKILI